MLTLLRRSLRFLDSRARRQRGADLVYLHTYKDGYAEYKREQILHNRRKLHHVWADETTLTTIKDYIAVNLPGRRLTGICHGARNGFEVRWFKDRLDADVLGTDISETALDYPDMVVWDFHEDNPDWQDRFDFVYSNSLDQAMDPRRALHTWAGQLKRTGLVFIEHTMRHSASAAGAMDPFGAHPMCMPYLFFVWGKGRYELCDILQVGEKKNHKLAAWIFVLKRSERLPP